MITVEHWIISTLHIMLKKLSGKTVQRQSHRILESKDFEDAKVCSITWWIRIHLEPL